MHQNTPQCRPGQSGETSRAPEMGRAAPARYQLSVIELAGDASAQGQTLYGDSHPAAGRTAAELGELIAASLDEWIERCETGGGEYEPALEINLTRRPTSTAEAHDTPSDCEEVKRRNLGWLEMATCKSIDIDGLHRAAEQPVLLLTDHTQDASERPRLSVMSVHATRQQALSSIESDGINVLPTVLIDLCSRQCPISVLSYDPVTGMSIADHVALPEQPTSATTSAQEAISGFIAHLREALGHYDYDR